MTKKLHKIEFNNYRKPDPLRLIATSSDVITNDLTPGSKDNSQWHYIADRYIGSPTSASLIDGIASYVFADGIRYANSTDDIYDIMDEEQVENAIKDLKLFGCYALLAVYDEDRTEIIQIRWVDIKKIAIYKHSKDTLADPIAYWFCEDWRDKNRFPPYKIPAFGSVEKDLVNLDDFDVDVRNTELLYVKIASQQPIFPLPNYFSCIEYAELEEQLANYYINHVKKSFSAGGIVNINQGVPDTDEAQDEAERAILSKLAGTSNAGSIIISFNDNKENQTEWTPFVIEDAYQQYQWLSEEASKKIMLGHKINDPALFGLPSPSGFNSVAEQLEMSQKILFRQQIKPLRKVFSRGLEKLLNVNKEGLKIKFIEFDELEVDAPVTDNTEIITPTE